MSGQGEGELPPAAAKLLEELERAHRQEMAAWRRYLIACGHDSERAILEKGKQGRPTPR